MDLSLFCGAGDEGKYHHHFPHVYRPHHRVHHQPGVPRCEHPAVAIDKGDHRSNQVPVGKPGGDGDDRQNRKIEKQAVGDDREETDDTLKNILTIPVSFPVLLLGKLATGMLLSLFLGLASGDQILQSAHALPGSVPDHIPSAPKICEGNGHADPQHGGPVRHQSPAV